MSEVQVWGYRQSQAELILASRAVHRAVLSRQTGHVQFTITESLREPLSLANLSTRWDGWVDGGQTALEESEGDQLESGSGPV